MTSIRSDVIVLPPDTLDRNSSSMRNMVTGAAATQDLWTWPAIAIVSSDDATPINMTVAAGHGFKDGDSVTVAGHDNVDANGTWVLGNVTGTTFDLVGSVGTPLSLGTAVGTVDYATPAERPKTKVWVTFEAVTNDAYIRVGESAAAGTTVDNGYYLKVGTPTRFYLTPSKHTTVDAYAPAGAGVLKWYVSSPPCERERI
jgi:hypothetical protein